ncbi:SAM hydrolase/SAM-dependent halogenase family protein [Methylicorpusculum sp.]|uniref:SAM hydrolase/SAM-dependent halogenase family protein n=1 Tax=Methylicorpusculum sp. TaxID=2713644 RepID=UPI0027268067|nr:SAM-dependent chlorinase/fluorinase [Methylicorpusculum sp.]MDO8843127.1 SAM-dependent chlorinase/fluorinase [Methylicorpusculum sp.]MDP2177414.1 SAM-dependent chlorinase/fluorinase [Methylicorpusculum sp.]MDP3530170.1 SAM-dependent chlorinase/fluorinase [Methylicorpusculum sp.]MDZ4153258.1 SAM-dependent chlorinase/fluorinase [Methylicorpusculum sp.]
MSFCFALFTDFGPAGPYLGQMESVLRQFAPHIPVIHLVSDAPSANPIAASYLLATLRGSFPEDTIFLTVVDPGVGGSRRPVVLCADGQYFVGPDNGLLNTVAVQAKTVEWYEIIWRPDVCSNSFHGRDIFAPVACALANGLLADYCKPVPQPDLSAWPSDCNQIIYFDFYGNAMTGLRYEPNLDVRQLVINEHCIDQASTFCSVETGQPFWYCNSSGLVEIAVNQGKAQDLLNLKMGDSFHLLPN